MAEFDVELARTKDRPLPATVWFPEDAPQAGHAYPLIAYSHGFMSRRREGEYAVRHLVSHGYVVISADFPHTGWNSPGGPNLSDVANQPADVSFLLDTVLAWSSDGSHRLHGYVDAQRIGATGVSLGGMTTTLLSFHRTLRDSRIKAAVSMAAPVEFFAPEFFKTAPVAYLGIYGTADAIIPYGPNAQPMHARFPQSSLLSLKDGSHTGFAHIAATGLTWLRSPDDLGCFALVRNLPPRGTNPFKDLGGEENGLFLPMKPSRPCDTKPRRSMGASAQQRITRAAMLAFFESQFAEDAATRAQYGERLARDFNKAYPDAYYEAGSARVATAR